MTWVLPGGQVTAQGAFNFSDIKVAITGGTGRFEGAGGVAIVRGTKNPSTTSTCCGWCYRVRSGRTGR